MKHVKFLLTSLALLLGVSKTYAQTVYSEIKPSVNAQQFVSATSADNSLHTGQLSVNIPLFALEGKGITVPISLAFNGGAITHESEASHIGLGWSLLAGGVITQTIRDKNDRNTTSSNTIPWQYHSNYLQSKWQEEELDAYDPNKFDIAMDAVMGFDGEPDIYNYSFLGYSGDICVRYDQTNILRTLYPDLSFKMEPTVDGYKIIGNDGTQYLFETEARKMDEATTWFLTQIKTIEGDMVVFHYTDDKSYDLTHKLASSSYASVVSKRLTRIDYAYGYVLFTSSEREDMYYNGESSDAKKITNIELYNRDSILVKGYELGNNSYLTTMKPEGEAIYWYDKRLKLDYIRTYTGTGNYLPPYQFEYDYRFDLPKNSSRDNSFVDAPLNTWAKNPTFLASVNRDIFDGSLKPSIDSLQGAMDHAAGSVDGYTTSDFLSLTKIVFPTGGSESYFYEKHDYGFVSTANDTIKPPYYPEPSSFIKGKRIWKKEINDGRGNTQIVEYKYCLHDNEYNRIQDDYFEGPRPTSSGVLVNPSIHTSTIYKPLWDQNPVLVGSPHYTREPQNSLSGSPIYYLEVEEIYKSAQGTVNGKKINFFERMSAMPAQNYIYLNHQIGGMANILTSFPNTLYGKQQYPDNEFSSYGDYNYTYLAYPVGRFSQSDLKNGKLLKEVTLNANGDIVRKVVNQYQETGGSILYGLVVQKFDDTADYTSEPYPSWNAYRYLISKTTTAFGVKYLVNRTTTNYHSNSEITTEEVFTYTPLNLLKSSSVTQSNGGELLREYVYPTEIIFQTESNLSEQALAIQAMKSTNIIGTPIQTTVKNRSEYVSGNYNTYKRLPNQAIVIDTTFMLGTQWGIPVTPPVVTTDGKVERHNGFLAHSAYLSYDANTNPTTVALNNGLTETIVWGYGGQYPVAKIQNYTSVELENNNTLANQFSLLDDYSVITESDRANLQLCNETIRNNLPPGVTVTTFTYDPLKGLTSQTDPNGRSTYYEYDSFGRIKVIRDHDWQDIKAFEYHYAGGD